MKYLLIAVVLLTGCTVKVEDVRREELGGIFVTREELQKITQLYDANFAKISPIVEDYAAKHKDD